MPSINNLETIDGRVDFSATVKASLARFPDLLNPHHTSGVLILAVVLAITGIVLSRVLNTFLRKSFQHHKFEKIDHITLSFLSNLVTFFTWFCVAILYAYLVPDLHRIGTALLTGIGVMSLIGGLAAQSTLSHLTAGISLLFFRPFRCGDRLQVLAPTKEEFEVGIVENMTLSYTFLKTDDGREIIIANGTLLQQTLIKLPPEGKKPIPPTQPSL